MLLIKTIQRKKKKNYKPSGMRGGNLIPGEKETKLTREKLF